MGERWQLGAGELPARIRNREVSSVEVFDAHLARVEQVNPRLNVIVRELADEARTTAEHADRAVAAGGPLGPLHGVHCTNPAQRCGIASIKPSVGVVPMATVVPPEEVTPSSPLMPIEGPLARCVADVRLGLSVVAGPDRRDPGSLPVTLTDAAPGERLPVGVRAIGDWFTDLRCLAVAEQIEQAIGRLTPIDPVTA